jgi:aminopeptidase N
LRSFDRWRRVDQGRRKLAHAQLLRIQARANLSRDVAEVVGKALEN